MNKTTYFLKLSILLFVAVTAWHCSPDSSDNVDENDDGNTDNDVGIDSNLGDTSSDSPVNNGDSDEPTYVEGTLTEVNCIRQCNLQWECLGIEDTSVHPLYDCETTCSLNIPLIECVTPHMGTCGPYYLSWYACFYSDIRNCDQYDAYMASAEAYYDTDELTAPDMSAPCAQEFAAYYDNCGIVFDTYFQDTDNCAEEIAAMTEWVEEFENFNADTDSE